MKSDRSFLPYEVPPVHPSLGRVLLSALLIVALLMAGIAGSSLAVFAISEEEGDLDHEALVADIRHAGSDLVNPTQPADDLDFDRIERLIMVLVDEIRAEHGLESLEEHPGISDAAQGHSDHMVEADFYDHVAPDGTTHQDRVNAVGLECFASENIAVVWYDRRMNSHAGVVRLQTEAEIAEYLVDAWMNSPGHRANILHEDFSRDGVGISANKAGKIYATHNFCT